MPNDKFLLSVIKGLVHNQKLFALSFEALEQWLCSGLMKPDTLLGENTRQIEVSDDQTTPYLFR
jgi:hypothetical protein